MEGTIQSILRDMENGVYDFTENGECSNCGQCCSNFLPVSAKEAKRIRLYVKKKKIVEQKHFLPVNGKTVDWVCPFRDNTNRKCVIYSVRPEICQDFQCDKPKKKIVADKAMYHGKYQIVDMRKEFFGDENH